MREEEQAFIERMGLAIEADGFPRIAGRLYGYLILGEGPFALDELAEALQVSKASISTNARLLEQGGIAERMSRPGDRRDFYRLAPNAPERIFEVARARTRAMRDLMRGAAGTLPEDLEVGRARLDRMSRLYDFFLRELESLQSRWRLEPTWDEEKEAVE